MNKDVSSNLIFSIISIAICVVLGTVLQLTIHNESAPYGETICALGAIVHTIVFIHRFNTHDRKKYKEMKKGTKENDNLSLSDQEIEENKTYVYKNWISFISICILVALSVLFFAYS